MHFPLFSCRRLQAYFDFKYLLHQSTFSFLLRESQDANSTCVSPKFKLTSSCSSEWFFSRDFLLFSRQLFHTDSSVYILTAFAANQAELKLSHRPPNVSSLIDYDSLLEAQQSFTVFCSASSSLEKERSLKKPEQLCPVSRAEKRGSAVQWKYPQAPIGVVTTGVWWNHAQLIVPFPPQECRRGQRTALYFCNYQVSSRNPRKKMPVFSISFFFPCKTLLQPEPYICSSASLSSFFMSGHSCLVSVSIMSMFLGLLRLPKKAKWLRCLNSLNCNCLTSDTNSLMGTPIELRMQLFSCRLRDRQSATKSVPQKQQSDRRIEPSSAQLNFSWGSVGQDCASYQCRKEGLGVKLLCLHCCTPSSLSSSSILGHLFHLEQRKMEYICSISGELNSITSGL